MLKKFDMNTNSCKNYEYKKAEKSNDKTIKLFNLYILILIDIMLEM